MPGQIHRMISTIIAERSKGNAAIAITTRTKLILKGVNPDKFSDSSDDDPALITKLRVIASELGVRL